MRKRVEPEVFSFSVGLFVLIVILAIVLALKSCATYPLQSKVIEPRSEAKANFR